jgi:hypothetical protein
MSEYLITSSKYVSHQTVVRIQKEEVTRWSTERSCKTGDATCLQGLRLNRLKNKLLVNCSPRGYGVFKVGRDKEICCQGF